MASLLDLAQARLQGLLDIPTRAARALVNPTAFSGLLGAPTLPQQQGMAEAAYGLPARQNMSVLDPNQAAYLQGYQQGEPLAYLGMATPFAAPAAVAGAKAVAPKAGIALENYMASQGLIQPLTAFHGTPHTIQGKFDISKVGTGEGAQAYGHGMYFAENPKVAEQYQTMAARVEPEALKYNNREILDLYNKAENAQQRAYRMPNGELKNKAIEKANAELSVWEDIMLGKHPQVLKMNVDNAMPDDVWVAKQEFVKNLDLKKFSGLDANIGNLYKVDIPDEYIPNMLDFDKPLLEQPENVLKSLKKLNDPYINQALTTKPKLSKDGEYWEYMGNTYASKSEALEDATPQRIISGYTGLGKTPQEVSQTLNNVGIKGVKYLDQFSRTEGGGTANFVVFDPTDVKILEKNSQKVEGLLD